MVITGRGVNEAGLPAAVGVHQGKSDSGIEHCHRPLSKALNDAVKRQPPLISLNPCQAVSPPRVYWKEVRTPSAQVGHRLLEAARDTEYYEALHTAFYTGIRRGELLALRWSDIDLDMATVSVSRTIYRAKGRQSKCDPPKTPKGRRLVSLTPSSALVLKALRERPELDGVLLGDQVTEGTQVFRYRNGSPIVPRAFRKIMRRARLEGYRLHDARHAHATLMLRQGCPSPNSPSAVGPCPHRHNPGHLQPRHPRAPRDDGPTLRGISGSIQAATGTGSGS